MAEGIKSLDLFGSNKYLTKSPNEIISVKEGTVYIYIVSVCGEIIGRSLFLGEAEAEQSLPALAVSRDDTQADNWMFMLVAKTKATIDVYHADKCEIEEVRKTFLDKYGFMLPEEDRFAYKLIKWYENELKSESNTIEQLKKERAKSNDSKLQMLANLFKTDKSITYENDTPSDLYNTVSVYCNYMNTKICSYQNLINNWGEDFTIQDIARLSHFVVRKITLAPKWYKHDSGAFLGFRKADDTPMLLIPKKRNRYVMYDLVHETDTYVGADEASSLAEEGYVIYQHFPSRKMKLSEVLSFGIKHIQTRDMVMFVAMYILSTLVGLILPTLNENLFDKLIPLGRMDAIYQVGMVIYACMVGNILFSIVQGLANFRAIKSLEYNIVSGTYDRIFRLPQNFIDKFGISELVTRINSVSDVFSSTVTSGTSAVLGFILSLFYLWKMFDKCKTLAWRGLIMSVLSCAIMFFISLFRISHERKKLEYGTKASNTLYQALAGILKIKVSGLENRSLYQYQKYNAQCIEEDMKSTRVSNIGNMLQTIMTMVYTGVIYYVVVKKNHELTIGEYTAFNSAYGMFTSAIGQLMSFFLTLAALIPVMERIKPIFEEETEVSDSSYLTSRLHGEIEVNHLDFAYEGDEQMILKDINIEIKPGEFVGIVGPSGCGKSTLLKCLLGFEKASKGKIYYDNKDIDTLDKCEMRRQMGIVLQNGKLVVGNIFTNITLAAPNMTPAEAEELLKEVDLYEDVQNMPMGIFTGISDGGGTVSGGQAQRVLIARALANKPSIIMFDEATSALDNVTQENVCNALKDRNITRIMIAHRLSTVKNCDKIIVMDRGEIKEQGSFTELMDKKGLFYQLALRQQVV